MKKELIFPFFPPFCVGPEKEDAYQEGFMIAGWAQI